MKMLNFLKSSPDDKIFWDDVDLGRFSKNRLLFEIFWSVRAAADFAWNLQIFKEFEYFFQWQWNPQRNSSNFMTFSQRKWKKLEQAFWWKISLWQWKKFKYFDEKFLSDNGRGLADGGDRERGARSCSCSTSKSF